MQEVVAMIKIYPWIAAVPADSTDYPTFARRHACDRRQPRCAVTLRRRRRLDLLLISRNVQAVDGSLWAFALKLDFGFISVWVFSVQEVVVCWGRCDVCLTQAD